MQDPDLRAPADATDCLRRAMQAHQNGDSFDADRWYARALQLEPQNSQALRLRGILARERGDVETSLKLLEQAAAAAPESAQPLAELALTRMASGDLQTAEANLRMALERAPNAIDVLTNLGALLQHRGHVLEAVDCYRQVLAQDGDEIEVRCNLVRALADAGLRAAALTAADEAIRLTGGRRGTFAARGAVLIDAERYEEARDLLLQAAELEGLDSMATVNLALCYTELGDLYAAIDWLRQAVETNPHNARAVADLISCMSAAEQDEEALLLGAQFLQAYPGERLVIGSYAQALLSAGRTAEAEALTACEQLVQVFDIDTPEGFTDLTEFNAQLAQLLCSDPSLVTDPVSKATTGGRQTGELDLSSAPAFARFRALANQCVSDAATAYCERGLAEHPVMLPAAQDWFLRAWGTLLDAGGFQSPHMHPLGWLSAVYYVAVPAAMNASDPQAGWLEFGQPPVRYRRQPQPAVRRYEPRPGRLIVFPSWFWHRTVPFDAPETRISIAFDVMPGAALREL